MYTHCEYTLLWPINLFHFSPLPPTPPIFQQLSVHILISSTFTDVMFYNITTYRERLPKSNSQTSASKRKNEEMGLHQTKELLHSKRNSHQTQETAHSMGENLCQLLTHQHLVLPQCSPFRKHPIKD
jgi:hypothetical protein